MKPYFLIDKDRNIVEEFDTHNEARDYCATKAEPGNYYFGKLMLQGRPVAVEPPKKVIRNRVDFGSAPAKAAGAKAPQSNKGAGAATSAPGGTA